MTRTRVTNADKRVLISLYERIQKTVDELRYTGDFDRLYDGFLAETQLSLSRHEVWRLLSNARKASRLVRKER